MIQIIRGQENTVVVTLDELATQEDHLWLFVFERVQDGEGNKKIFTAPDISSTPSRYNKFIIEETESENLYNGQVTLKPSGQWNYTVYEMPVSSPPSLDIEDAYGIVEEGRLLVIDNSETTRVSFDEDDERNNVTFNE